MPCHTGDTLVTLVQLLWRVNVQTCRLTKRIVTYEAFVRFISRVTSLLYY